MKKNWLENFRNFWLKKDIDSVLNLFSDELEYFETPYFKIENKNVLKKEWEAINEHNIDKINFDVFCEYENKIVVQFEYFYEKDWKNKKYLWVYLIKFDKNWKCNYFYQVWE